MIGRYIHIIASFPFPLVRGRVHPEGFSLKGIKGMGLLKKN
jgi:hypothetical protein